MTTIYLFSHLRWTFMFLHSLYIAHDVAATIRLRHISLCGYTDRAPGPSPEGIPAGSRGLLTSAPLRAPHCGPQCSCWPLTRGAAPSGPPRLGSTRSFLVPLKLGSFYGCDTVSHYGSNLPVASLQCGWAQFIVHWSHSYIFSWLFIFWLWSDRTGHLLTTPSCLSAETDSQHREQAAQPPLRDGPAPLPRAAPLHRPGPGLCAQAAGQCPGLASLQRSQGFSLGSRCSEGASREVISGI